LEGLAVPTLACATEKFTRFFSTGKNAYPFGSLHKFARGPAQIRGA
jgi:hypothetical protein